MILRREKRSVPQLNTTSTADISFILLVFFLIMTSMDTDKGLSRMLPAMTDKERQEETTDIERSNVLSIRLTETSQLVVDGKECGIGQLKQKVTSFVNGASDARRLIISIDIDRNASYDAYFNIQNEIAAAYNTIRGNYAMKKYGHAYERCTPEERETVRTHYPQRIVENTTVKTEGGAR
jgi:biopolymer transport protein ExbD